MLDPRNELRNEGCSILRSPSFLRRWRSHRARTELPLLPSTPRVRRPAFVVRPLLGSFCKRVCDSPAHDDEDTPFYSIAFHLEPVESWFASRYDCTMTRTKKAKEWAAAAYAEKDAKDGGSPPSDLEELVETRPVDARAADDPKKKAGLAKIVKKKKAPVAAMAALHECPACSKKFRTRKAMQRRYVF